MCMIRQKPFFFRGSFQKFLETSFLPDSFWSFLIVCLNKNVSFNFHFNVTEKHDALRGIQCVYLKVCSREIHHLRRLYPKYKSWIALEHWWCMFHFDINCQHRLRVVLRIVCSVWVSEFTALELRVCELRNLLFMW